MTMFREQEKSRRALIRQGFTVTKTRRGHYRVEHPDMDGPVFMPCTPSDHRSMKNFQAQLRRKLRSSTMQRLAAD